MDQDVGSSVITHIFANTPALYAWGLKPTTTDFQVIYTSNGRTRGTITLPAEKYKHSLHNYKIVFTMKRFVTRT